MRVQKKGSNGERELAKALQSFGLPVRRGYLACNEPDLVGLRNIHIECKTCAEVDVSAWITQSVISAARYGDGLPVVMFRQVSRIHRGLPWMVLMRYEDYISMGGHAPVMSYEPQFRGGIYKKMDGVSALGFTRLCGEVVCMHLNDWVELWRKYDDSQDGGND